MRERLRPAVLLAFAAVWLIWGSTYLAIRVVLETLPPFTMAGVRFVAAGLLLGAFSLARGAARPTRAQWGTALVLGGLLFLGGNGAVVWAEQRIASGLAALLVAIEPLWVVLLQARSGAGRPSARAVLGVVLGIAGLLVLIGPWNLGASDRVDLAGSVVVVAGSLSWAIGSLAGRTAKLPEPPPLAAATQMLAGGALLLVAGLAAGEPARVVWSAVSLRSVLALAYLALFGSIVAFTAYLFLLRQVSPARASTYAFVNPVVAVVLGAWLGGEPLTPRLLAAGALIVGAVVLITLGERGAKG
ncbi:hypothetical protein FBQ97_07535 [Acidobacteria bacterium ACD]|nr:MAG: hypothetical protein EDX89_03675 [Acidobacteriota bacterium]MDL1949650.1 hypothetical protein [Acidobacteria bacterium ACD]